MCSCVVHDERVSRGIFTHMLPSPQIIFMMLCHQLRKIRRDRKKTLASFFSFFFSFFVVIVLSFFFSYNNRINVGSFPGFNEKKTRKSVNKR